MIIDGRRITPQAGASILETAREIGSAIPSLCHHPGLPSDGSCRMCLVEVDGRSGLHPACVLPATDDLVVRTETDNIQAERRSLLRLLLGKGAITARAVLTDRIARGTVFLPFHFAEAAANVLTNAALDPIAKIPEFKVCAVGIEPAAEGVRGERLDGRRLSLH